MSKFSVVKKKNALSGLGTRKSKLTTKDNFESNSKKSNKKGSMHRKKISIMRKDV